MRIIMLAALPLTLAAAPSAAPPKPCKLAASTVGADRTVRVRRLDEMPPAKQLLGVYREVRGCPEPVVLREQVGTPARR